MINKLQPLIELIERDLQPIAILLYGSVARGDSNENSDIDLLIIHDQDQRYEYNMIFENRYIDGWVKPLSDFSQENLENFIHLKDAHILKDHNQYFGGYLKQVKKAASLPPSPISKQEKKHIHMWCHKTLKRAELLDHEGIYRLHWLLTELLTYYFKLRNLHYLGPKESFQFLKHNDIATYHLFDHAMRNHLTMKHVELLVKAVII